MVQVRYRSILRIRGIQYAYCTYTYNILHMQYIAYNILHCICIYASHCSLFFGILSGLVTSKAVSRPRTILNLISPDNFLITRGVLGVGQNPLFWRVLGVSRRRAIFHPEKLTERCLECVGAAKRTLDAVIYRRGSPATEDGNGYRLLSDLPPLPPSLCRLYLVLYRGKYCRSSGSNNPRLPTRWVPTSV